MFISKKQISPLIMNVPYHKYSASLKSQCIIGISIFPYPYHFYKVSIQSLLSQLKESTLDWRWSVLQQILIKLLWFIQVIYGITLRFLKVLSIRFPEQFCQSPLWSSSWNSSLRLSYSMNLAIWLIKIHLRAFSIWIRIQAVCNAFI